MNTAGKAAAVVGLTVAIVLTALAAVGAWFQGRYGLPAPILGHVLAVILPLVSFLAMMFPNSLGRLALSRVLPPSIAPAILAMLDTVLFTLASTELQQDHVWCALNGQWQSFFHNKNAGVVRRIQDDLECCGLWSNVDRAWPFPDPEHTASYCRDHYGRQNRCGDALMGKLQFVLGVWIAVGVSNLLTKVIAMMMSDNGTSWFHNQPQYTRIRTGRITSPPEGQRYLDQPAEQPRVEDEAEADFEPAGAQGGHN